MEHFKVSYYFENDEDEVDFVKLDFDAEDLDSLLIRLEEGDHGEYEPDEETNLDGVTDWSYFYIEDFDGVELFCSNDDYRKLLLDHYS
jgi:hypothetical protein